MTEQGINKVRINLTKEIDLGKDFPGGSEGKASVYNVGDLGSIPGSAIHSSTIAWKIPCTEEPGRLQSMGLQRGGHD